ncbi:MAG: hypothetical protein EBT62_00910 [Opitutaceae bacterium]|nr:hypothetical protein [Opitutaceae bacterium]
MFNDFKMPENIFLTRKKMCRGKIFLENYLRPADFISRRLRTNALIFSAVRPVGFSQFFSKGISPYYSPKVLTLFN